MTRKIRQSPKLPPEERRQQLLAAARKLFWRKGYRNTTTEEIAREAGVTKGALYFHFKNKEQLLRQLLVAMHDELIESVAGLPEAQASPAELLKGLIDMKITRENIDVGDYLDFWVQALRIPPVRRLLEIHVAEYTEKFADKLHRNFGRTRRQRLDMAVCILSLYDGLYVRKMLNDPAADYQRQVNLFSSLIGK